MRSKEEERNYNNVHKWLKNHYGKAHKCENPNCTGKSNNYNWAKLKDKPYEKNINNFQMLCKSCHTKYDFTDKTIEKMKGRVPWNKGKSDYLSDESKRKMGSSIARKCINTETGKIYNTLKEACEDLNISYSTTNKILNGHYKTKNNKETIIKYLD